MKLLTKTILFLFLTTTFAFGQQDIAYLRTALSTNVNRAKTADIAVLPFELRKGMIYVQAQVNEQTSTFLLDTGAPGLVLNEKPNAEESPYEGISCSGSLAVGVRQVEQFQWAAGSLANVEALTVDLAHLETSSQQAIGGMIGYEMLRRFVVVLDYQENEILLTKRKTWRQREIPAAQVVLPFELVDHLPVVSLEMPDGQILRLGIDTGAAANLLDAAVELSTAEVLGVEEVQGLDQAVQKVTSLKVDDLLLGSLSVDSKFLQLNFAAGAEADLDGLLGYPFLSQFIVAIDYNRQEVLLWER